MRSIALMEAALSAGIEITVLTKDQLVSEILEKHKLNVTCVILPDMTIEAEMAFYRTKGYSDKDWLIVDHYEVSPEYFRSLNLNWNGKIAYIDDLHRFNYAVDLVINHGVGAEKISYESWDQQKPKILVGLQYFMLRSEFKREVKPGLSKVIKSILLTSGGTDQNNYLLKITQKLLTLGDEMLYVLIGPGFANVFEFIRLAESNPNVRLVCNSDAVSHKWDLIDFIELKDLFKLVDFSFSTVGTSAFELIYSGIPVAGFASIDNQLDNLRNLIETELIYPMSTAVGFDEESIAIAYKDMVQFETRNKLVSKGLKAIDGDGAFRIINTLKELNNND